MTPTVDRTVLKVNQIVLISILALGYIMAVPGAIVIAAILLTWALVSPTNTPQRYLYGALQRSGIIRAQVVQEDATPHRFAQQLGASMLIVASVVYAVGLSSAAWVLALIVLVLALINVGLGFCAGCFLHMHIQRWRHKA